MHQRPRQRGLAVMFVSAVLLAGCGASEGDGEPSIPAPESSASFSESASGSASESVSSRPTSSSGAAIPGDGTWKVGTEVQPGVYVASGGEDCRYQRLDKVDVEYLDVIVQGFLSRPIIEIKADDGGFRSDGCGSWTPLDSYDGTLATEVPGDGIWLVGEDVEPGTYQAEGHEWCLWSRISGWTPDISSVIKGGASKKATIEEGDLGFVTEGCGAWTKVE